jgi:ribosomal-protein-alanine N-acetyltransferase
VRKIINADIPRLVAIELLTQAAPWSEDVFKRCLAIGYDGWCVERDNQLIAFIMMSSTLSGESHILNLCVDPAYQRQGFGQALLAYAVSQASIKGMTLVYLEVRRSNQHAIELYNKLGFIQIGERKNYYPHATGREDALVFVKDILLSQEF